MDRFQNFSTFNIKHMKEMLIMDQFDVAVLGAGPGGYVAAIRAAQLGLKVAVVEKEHLGGVCLNYGCIPTKSLLRSAEVYRTALHAESYGVHVSNPKPNLQKMVARSREISGQLTQGIQGLLKKNKITHIQGLGKFSDSHTLTVDHEGKSRKISFKHAIIATGATARELPHLKADGKRIWLARHAMIPPFEPKNLLIIGSGAIGIEFASFYQTIGVHVTVVEMLDRILPQEDKEISKTAQKSFEDQGIQFLLNTSVETIKSDLAHVDVTFSNKEHKTYDAVILAIGIVGNTDNIGLENTKVKAEKNQIKVNQFCQTDESHIYAIGDVAGAPWLAHKASHEGVMAADHIAGLKAHPLGAIPGCTYSHPQIASVGLTEDKAKELKKEIKVGRFPFKANGKALAMGESDGFIKTIFDTKTGELLGAHMIGAEVTELVQGFVIAMGLETTEEDLMNTIFPHPTLSEMMHESVLNAYSRTIHF